MTELYVPASYVAAQAREAAIEFTKAQYGPDIGPSVVLGPLGGLDRAIRQRSGEKRHADKAIYYELYMRHPFVYACVELICQTAAQDRHTYPADADLGKAKSGKPTERNFSGGPVTKAKYEDDDDLGKTNDGVEFLETFFAEVNDYESFQDLLQSIYRDMLVSGEAFILKQRNGVRVANGMFSDVEESAQEPGPGRYTHVVQDAAQPIVCLHRIPSRETWAVPGPDGYPSLFRQRNEGGGWREFKKEDVIFFRMPDPTDPSHGLAPLEALDLSLATDMQAAKYNEAYFRNGAKAGIILSMQGVSEPEVRRNREWINTEYVKPENAHKPMTLVGNVQLVRDGNKAQNDMEFLKLRQFTREEIAAVYSVPLSKLLMESNTLGQAGKMSDDITFRADTVGPLQTKVYETINRQLMKKDFPDKPLLIPPRQEKIRLDLLEAASNLVKVGGTGNEARAVLHLPEIDDDEWMNKPLFFQPGIRPIMEQQPDESQNELGTPGAKPTTPPGKPPMGIDTGSRAGRTDKTSQRTSAGVTNAKVKRGIGMKTRS